MGQAKSDSNIKSFIGNFSSKKLFHEIRQWIYKKFHEKCEETAWKCNKNQNWRNWEFPKKDFKPLETEGVIFDWACRQTYIPLANMMTAASMIGIDSCPMEGFNVEKVEAVLDKDLGIDTKKIGVSCMVAFGYRKKEPGAKTRQSMDKIVEWYR